MASSADEAASDGGDVRSERGKKSYMAETRQCLVLARQSLPRDVYDEFVKTMTEIWKRSVDPDGEIRNISVESYKETVMELFQGQPEVMQGFIYFTQGHSPFKDNAIRMENPLDFIQRLKRNPDITNEEYAAIIKTLLAYRKQGGTMTVADVFHNVKKCLSNCPELLDEFIKVYLPPRPNVALPDEESCRNLKPGRVGEAISSITPDAYHNLDSILMEDDDSEEGYEEPPCAEEGEEDKVEPLPDWIPSREKEFPPKADITNCKRYTRSYYLLPDNCITLQSSYQTELGRSIFNDCLVCSTSGSERSDGSKCKTKNESSAGCEESDSCKPKIENKFESTISACEEEMFESDMLLHWFSETADFISNLQQHVDRDLKINEHLSPLHRKCIQKLYNDDYDHYCLLESKNTSAALAVLLSRLNQKVEDLSEARLCLHKTRSQVIAKNYYKSLDHHGPSFKILDTKRMSQKALLVEAKEINKTRLNVADEYANPVMHEDISSIISSACASDEKQMMTWTKLVHPFLSANCQWPDYLKETVAHKEACEDCGIKKDFLGSIPNDSPAHKLSLTPKSGGKNSIDCSSSHDVFDAEIEEGEFIPAKEPTSSDVSASVGDGLSFRCLATDTSRPSTCDHGNEPESQHESRQHSRRTAKSRGVKGGACCSLMVLCRLYQILYERLQTARNLCTSDLYEEFKEKLCRLLDHSIDNCNFEDFCLKFLGPKSFELFTLDKVIKRVTKQLCILSSSDQDNSLLQFLEKLRRPIQPKILPQHQSSPTQQSNGLLKHDREEQEKASIDDTGKLTSRHFQRRKKRKLENCPGSCSQLGIKDSNS
ncbi:paired amphipathic helix protein Sin3-like 5 isoform X1 [Brachypodium distachyon]|uniref:Histone deacetylase interacting domain-containing protein n=2 Tax=Brachypodium distachyon TaxID=15368 RepID=A0A0Q3QSY2_BRADI|nr:paired amphipathic helix protein Sin3-like 5 isoform X1 [Brachypodium distachyon]KQK04610.1 hypothetical protein BRADI_2g14621v3 [Brachypodium distachyon]|eukprot:XP_010230963.1 paired amphipathic helix protein Sin3-like 5 isoform X1 [Brachypodium distachyon]